MVTIDDLLATIGIALGKGDLLTCRNGDPGHPLRGCYDPRLTVLNGRLYLCFACGLRGTRGGVAVTDDLERWEVLHVSEPDNRNMVLFPERFDGKLGPPPDTCSVLAEP
jgi:predicted GH43/DUF377 family glycosyl hydrolase